MIIGIVRETKIPPDRRVPLSPRQCRQLEEKYPSVKIIVQPSPDRCFPDDEYRQEGIVMKEDIKDCDVFFGIKEVRPHDLIAGKMYFFFSHTIKKQEYNRGLLKEVLEKKIRLLDYEILTEANGTRIIGFGRWAGLIGTYNGIRAFCLRNRMPELLPPQECNELNDLIEQVSNCKLPPVKIAITGDGRVASGCEEMLTAFGAKKVSLEEYIGGMELSGPVYIKLGPDKYNRHKSGNSFDLNHFFKNPESYESNFFRFCKMSDLLVMAAYWDPRAPVLFTADQMRDKDFRIKVIADISCDLHGSVPSSIRATTFSNPFYDFNPLTGIEETPFLNPGNVTVMTIDNLPCGLPKESSVDFGDNLIRHVIPHLFDDDPENILARATIAKNGKLSEKYNYLKDWVEGGI